MDIEFSGKECLFLYDVENLRSGYDRLQALRKMILAKFPGISIRDGSFANTDNVTESQRRSCLRVGCPIQDVTCLPGPNSDYYKVPPMAEGVGDRGMMMKLFTFARDFHPPNLVILASGDKDFSTPLRAVKDMGFTTVLVCNPASTPVYLLESANYVYDWNKILSHHGFSGGPSGPPQILPCLNKRAINMKRETLVIWDMDTIALPAYIHQDAANKIVIDKVIRPNIQHVGEFHFKVYGSRLPFDHRKSVVGVEYVETTTNPNFKEHHLEANIISDLGTYICHNKQISNVIILSRNTNLTETITWLANKGYNVGLVGGKDKFMRDAASFNVKIPSWYSNPNLTW